MAASRRGRVPAPELLRVAIDRSDGDQTTLYPGDDLVGPGGESVELHQVADVLSRPGGWVELPTVVERETENEWEDNGPERPARMRIMAAGVCTVMTVYAGPDA